MQVLNRRCNQDVTCNTYKILYIGVSKTWRGRKLYNIMRANYYYRVVIVPVTIAIISHYFQTGRSRGFSFVYFESSEDAKVAKEQCTGMEIDGRRIRVDFSITQRAHTPTPGIYMGKPT